MVRWLAPILSLTAEEAWGHLPGVPNESVFLNLWHQFPAGAERVPAIDWPALIALKADVAREMERLRAAGLLGSSLEAEVTVYVLGSGVALRIPARRAEISFDHELCARIDAERASGDRGQGKPGGCLDRSHAQYPAEMRALLSAARGCRERPSSPGNMRALRP